MDRLFALKAEIQRVIWGGRLSALPPWKGHLISALRIGYLVIRDVLDGQLTLRAMSLVYTTLLSLVPLIAVSFSVLKGFGVHNQVEPLLLGLLTPLGEKGVEITSRIIEFVENMKAGVLGSVGLALLLYTVVSLIQKIEHAFNYTWHVSEDRPLAQRFSDYLSAILIGPVLIFTALGITASISSAAVMQQLMAIEPFGTLIQFMTRLLPYILVIVAFTAVYIFVPNTKVRIGSALVGATVAGVLWETTGWAFTSFVVTSAKYTAIYSAFATLIIFMIWLYVSWLILLVGASIAFYHQYPERRILQRQELHLSNRLKEKLTLLIMALIGQHFYHQRPAWTVQTLARHLNVAVESITPILECLVNKKLLARSNEVPASFLPSQPPETMQLLDVVTAVRKAEEGNSLNLELLPKDNTVDALFDDMERSLRNSLQGKTLKDLSLADVSLSDISPSDTSSITPISTRTDPGG